MSRFIHDSYGGVPVGFASTEQLLVNMFNIFLDDSQQLHSPPIGLRFAGIVPIAIALLAMVYVARSEQAGPVFSLAFAVASAGLIIIGTFLLSKSVQSQPRAGLKIILEDNDHRLEASRILASAVTPVMVSTVSIAASVRWLDRAEPELERGLECALTASSHLNQISEILRQYMSMIHSTARSE